MVVSGVVTGRRDGRLQVRVERSGGCGRCDQPGGCGGHKTSHLFGAPRAEYLVDSRDDFADGERVELVAPEGLLLQAAALAYGLPLLLALFGAALISLWLPGREGFSALGAGLGLAGGFLLARKIRSLNPGAGIQVRRALSSPCAGDGAGHA